MRATFMRGATVARQVLLLLLPPRNSTVTKYYTVVPSMAFTPPSLPVPKTTADDKSMRVRGFRRRPRRRPLFCNFVGLALGVSGTDDVLEPPAGNVGIG